MSLRMAMAPIAEFERVSLRILVYLVIYDSGQVSLEHLLLSRNSSQRFDLMKIATCDLASTWAAQRLSGLSALSP